MSDQPSLFDFDDDDVPIPRPVLEQIRIVRIGDSASGTIEEQFLRFHEANPGVYQALRYLAVDLVQRGEPKLGIGMLFEVLRWQMKRLRTLDPDSPFKLNNNYRRSYSRRLMANEPELVGRFETREIKTP